MVAIAAALCALPAMAWGFPNPLVLDVGYESISTGHHLQYLSSDEGDLPLEEIAERSPEKKWQEIAGPTARVGITNAKTWFRMRIENPSDFSVSWMLDLGNPLLEGVAAFIQEPKTNKVSPLRAVSDNHPIYALRLGPNEKARLFIQASAVGQLFIQPTFWKEHHLYSKHLATGRGEGILYGFVMSLILLSLGLYVRMRNQSTLYFIGYVLGTSLFLAIADGLFAQVIWPHALSWSTNIALNASTTVVTIAGALFARKHLNLQKTLPGTANGLRVLAVVSAATLPILLLGWIPSFLPLELLLLTPLSAMMIWASYTLRKNPLVKSKVFGVSQVPLVAGLFVHLVAWAGVVPTLGFRALAWGLLLHVVCMAFSESTQIHHTTKSESRAAIDALAVQRKAADYLFAEVARRTRDLKRKTREAELARKEAQANLDELQQAQTQLVQAEKMSSLGQLVAGVAHEINNPVNFVQNCFAGIIQAVERVESTLNDILPDGESGLQAKALFHNDFDKITELSGHHEMGTVRINAIVKSLTSFARLDEAEFKPADVNQVVEQTLIILSNRVKRIQLDKQLAPCPEIECMPSQLGQVILNLITNALDACMPLRGPRDTKISVSTELQNENIHIQVQDNGPGIDDEVKSTLFDPFVTTKAVGKGTGMGLAISYNIIRDHNGRIDVDSSPAGTIFTIVIPVRHPREQAEVKSA